MKTNMQARRSGQLVLPWLLLASSLIGCALSEGPRREDKLQAALPEQTAIPGEWTSPEWDTGEVDDGWIASFGDDALVGLVDEAIANNLNLRAAATRVERAEGFAQLAEAGLLPTVGAGAQASRLTHVGGQDVVPTGRAQQAGAVISWEADVWGRVRAGVDAARQSLVAAQADLEGARLSLAGQTAKAWFLAQELRVQVQLAEQAVALNQEVTALVRRQFQVGAVSRADVFLVEANLAQAEDALRQARIAETQTVRMLELLLGRYPGASLETTGRLVAVPARAPVGMPSELLERRPDLVAAERRVAVAFRLEEQARLARLPSFTFSLGINAISDLSTIVSEFVAGVTVPIYAPALQAQIAIASADQQAALAAYGQAALRALEEVETGLFNDHILSEREDFLRAKVEANRNAYELHRRQLQVGAISALPVLQVQARYLGSEVLLTRVRNERLAQRVDLHLALGGSF